MAGPAAERWVTGAREWSGCPAEDPVGTSHEPGHIRVRPGVPCGSVPFGYARDLQPDLAAAVAAVEGVLAVHEPSKLEYSPGYVCAVCFDKPWPCPTRAAIRQALLATTTAASNPNSRLGT
jgi:hypothetical protein